MANQLKTILPWLCVVALAAGTVLQRSRSKGAETELAALRQANQELKKTRVEEEDLKKIQAQVEELGRLRKENEELHRLRNEIRQLREEKQGVARAGQSGRPPPTQPRADAPGQAQLLLQSQQLLSENERLRAENQQLQQLHQLQANAQLNGCINNMRIIAGAKDQWALENKKPVGTTVGAEDIQPYLKNNALPPCPQGGTYTINAVGALPACNIPGHVFPQQ